MWISYWKRKGDCNLKYFEIVRAPEHKYAPRLTNWYGKIDVRDICIKKYPDLPKRELFVIESSEKTIFTDIILFPFLLLSPNVMDVIKMYHERCFYREVILLDQLNGKSELYYLPVFDETDKLLLSNRENFIQEEEIKLKKEIFWIWDSFKRHTIISLDLAESLVWRGITGLGIKEIKLHTNK